MLKLQFTESAREDLVNLSEMGLKLHGEEAVALYHRLIRFTIDKLRENPNEIGVRNAPREIKMFHLRHFRKEVEVDEISVKKPSHFICYRVLGGDLLEVVRILRDNRQFELHLP